MSIAPYIREIGRGKHGSRSLNEEQAHDLMSHVLDGNVSDLEIGAFVLAMRIKGESNDELSGFLQAVRERCVPVRPRQPTVVLPSYNGARKLPNLTPLLALLLAQEGVPVLVHGPRHDAGRVTTAEIFHSLGLPVLNSADDIDATLQRVRTRHEPVFVPIDVLCPPLAKLLHVRSVIGLRNSGHTVAKLLDPCMEAPSLRVVNYTHPEYGSLLHAFLQRAAANALLMRGTEGEPVADPRRQPRMEMFIAGQAQPSLSLHPQEGVLAELPILPKQNDATTTALYIQSVISGEQPAPTSVQQQCDVMLRALAHLSIDATPRQANA